MLHQRLYFLSLVTCHALSADWLALHVKLGDCSRPTVFYLSVFPIRHAFTHQIMFVTDDFKTPYIYPPQFPQVSYHVWYQKSIDSMCVPVCRSLENLYMYNYL